MKRLLDGINIQYPISRLILDGTKTIETRTYPLPNRLVGRELVLVETPGKTGDFQSRGVAIIKFGESVQYKNKKHFYEAVEAHCVTPDSPWAWKEGQPKWAWPILSIYILSKHAELKRRPGIVYTKNIEISQITC
jgi:hypothetical protein